MPTESSFSGEVELSDLTIRPLDPKMDRAAFCCGNSRIDNFFRNNVPKQHGHHKVRAYVAILGGDIAGYYYLVAASRDPEVVSQEADAKFGRVGSAPCVYLGMIGTQQKYQGNGIGKTLMLHAMQQTLRVAGMVGIYALVLDAVDEETACRYERWGFQRFIQGELSMFIPLRTIKVLFEG